MNAKQNVLNIVKVPAQNVRIFWAYLIYEDQLKVS